FAQYLQGRRVTAAALRIGGIRRERVWGCNTITFSLRHAYKMLRGLKRLGPRLGAASARTAALVAANPTPPGQVTALQALFGAGLGVMEGTGVNVSYMYRMADLFPNVQLALHTRNLPGPLRRFLENPCR